MGGFQLRVDFISKSPSKANIGLWVHPATFLEASALNQWQIAAGRSFRRTACITNAHALAAPSRNKAEYCPFHTKTLREASANKPKQVGEISAVQRSADVRAGIGPIPSRVSSGVRSSGCLFGVSCDQLRNRCAGDWTIHKSNEPG
jgi:hypothetical protein